MAQTKVVNNIELPLTDEEIQEKLASDKKHAGEYAKIEYIEKRVMAYPSIGDQLDALYHAGIFPKEISDKLKAVKDAHPKPE